MPTSRPLSPSSSNPRKRKPDFGSTLLARPPKAQKSYYGIPIHALLDAARDEAETPNPEPILENLPTPPAEPAISNKKGGHQLWTEKYRARKFTDLIGDERTHRSVMHWLKRWDPVVFGNSHRKVKAKASSAEGKPFGEGEKPHKKLLLLTGPPGLGKTTLAHVCVRQAGYEVQEINASDERSGAVVKGRIRDMVATENVRGSTTSQSTTGSKIRKAGKPVCVVIDEVDGVVTGSSSSSGEGGFVKALIDLILLDQKNSTPLNTLQQAPSAAAKRKKGERFRLLRPIILICNDIYHPSLRPLRQSSHAEVIHVRKPPVATLISRLQGIFDKERVPCESDGVRRLCEATWGVSNRKEDRRGNGAGEGDMRGIMVVGEWVAGKLRAMNCASSGGVDAKLTRRWVEEHVLNDLAHGGGAARGLGRGGPRDIVERVFQENAGFPKSALLSSESQAQHNTSSSTTTNSAPISATESAKRTSTNRLRELLDTSGDTDRILLDTFTTYPTQNFQDDTLLSKPAQAYEWLHFHDRLSGQVFGSNEWELAPYFSTPILGFHHLFASASKGHYSTTAGGANFRPNDDATADTEDPPLPFTGPQASWAAHEAEKHNLFLLQTLQSSLCPELNRSFTSPAALATDFLPYLLRMLSPNINPVLVGTGTERATASVRKGSETLLVSRAVRAMQAASVRFEKTKVTQEAAAGAGAAYGPTEFVYRMTPALDEFGIYGSGGKSFGEAAGGIGGAGKSRFAVRQVLEAEFGREEKRCAEVARLARFRGSGSAGAVEGSGSVEDAENVQKISGVDAVKKDFFGRPIALPVPGSVGEEGKSGKEKRKGKDEGQRVWVTFHEGFSNAVRKPITLAELMRDM